MSYSEFMSHVLGLLQSLGVLTTLQAGVMVLVVVSIAAYVLRKLTS